MPSSIPEPHVARPSIHTVREPHAVLLRMQEDLPKVEFSATQLRKKAGERSCSRLAAAEMQAKID